MISLVQKLLHETLTNLGITYTGEILLELSSKPEFGDFTTNIALRLAKTQQKNPFLLATVISDSLISEVFTSQAVMPGYINVTLNTKELIKESAMLLTPKKILVEYGQPNTHKLPHIGHLYSFIFGESISRLFEETGNTVIRLNYQGDIGLHVAKCLWAYKKNSGNNVSMEFLQICYQEGSRAYEEDSIVKSEIIDINQKLNNKTDEKLNMLWQETRNTCIEFYKIFEKELSINYDKHYFESENVELGKKLVQNNTMFEASEGATVFKGEQYGLHTRVFINKYGVPTYEGKDMGLITRKREDYAPFDISYVLTANEQNEYSKVIIKASELIYPDLNTKLKHLGFGLINLKSGKMSSRSGTIITATGLIQEVEEALLKESKDVVLAKSLALSSIKYSFLRSNALVNMQFDVETSISKDGDSAIYILYNLVRMYSILKNSEHTNIDVNLLTKEDIQLLRIMYQFPYIIKKASLHTAPHIVCNYLYALTKAFAHYYEHTKVLSENKNLTHSRLGLVKRLSQIITKGLYTLGITPVKHM